MSKRGLTLITGASGFVGSHIAALLAKQGRPLRLLMRKNSPTDLLKGISYETVEGDLRDYRSIKKAMEDVEYVYHVAALYSFWSKRKDDFKEINVEGTKNVCMAAQREGVEKLVYTSTAGAIGISDDPLRPCDEKTEWKDGWIKDPYVISKREAELVVLSYVSKGLPAVILNPTGPVGPGDIKPTPTGKMIVDYSRGRMPFSTKAHFSLVDVRDVAKGHYLAEKIGKVGERYILSAQNISTDDLLAWLSLLVGQKIPSIPMPHFMVRGMAPFLEALSYITRKPPMINRSFAKILSQYFWFDATKSQQELGLVYHPVDQAIRDAYEWFKKQGYIK